MKKLLAIALFLSASVNAYAVDGGAVLGGALGGAAGAAIGYQVGGKTGAIVGAAVGGGAGAGVGARNEPAQPVQVQRDREDGGEHRHRDNGRHNGEHKHHHEE